MIQKLLTISVIALALARGLYAAGENTFDTLTGLGASVSASAGPFSGSVSLPYMHKTYCDDGVQVDDYGSYPPVFEAGFGRGSARLTETFGRSYAFGRNTFLGDIGRSISGFIFDLTH